MEESRNFTNNMGIIKASEIFRGNILEKNEQRINMIKKITDDDLLIKIEKFFKYIREYNLQGVQYIIENELFYEKVPDYIINKYIIKLNKNCNIEDFKYAYRLKAKNGFRRTMDYLVRIKH